MNGVAVKVGELFAARPPMVSPARYPEETFELYSVPAYDRGVPDVLLGRDIGSAKQVVVPGDVLLSRIVPHIRRAWVVGKLNGPRLLASSEWIVLNSERTAPRYLRFLLTSDEFHRHFMTTVGGVGGSLLRAQRDQVAQIEVSLPAIDEQRRIASVLEAVSRSLELESRSVSRSIVLKAEVMSELFTRGLRGESQKGTEIGEIPESWRQSTLGEVCRTSDGRIQTGPFGSQLHASDYQLEGVPVINPTHLEGNRINDKDVPRIDTVEANRLRRHRVGIGDILFARRGEIGRHGLVGEDEAGWMCGTGCFLVRLRNPHISTAFMSYLFSTEPVVSWLKVHSAGSIMANLNNTVLARLPVAFPIYSEQLEIVHILDAIDRKIYLHKRKRAVLGDLFNALLNGLMTGAIDVLNLDLTLLDRSAPDDSSASAA